MRERAVERVNEIKNATRRRRRSRVTRRRRKILYTLEANEKKKLNGKRKTENILPSEVGGLFCTIMK